MSSQNGQIKFYSVWAILFRQNKMHGQTYCYFVLFGKMAESCLQVHELHTVILRLLFLLVLNYNNILEL